MKALRVATVFALVFAAGNLVADTKAVIAKARAYIGSEEALNALRSIQYQGVLQVAGDKPEAKMIERQVEITFQKPFQQRIAVKGDDIIEATGLDDYEAWQRIEDPKDASRWRMTLLGPDEIKRRRANTWENLSFYLGLESRGGRIEDLGQTTIDGVECHHLAFFHEPGIVFHRYFDVSSGRLVLTETGEGDRIREEGQLESGGLRFPKSLISTKRTPDGKERVVTLRFHRVVTNQAFPDSLFRVPSMLK